MPKKSSKLTIAVQFFESAFDTLEEGVLLTHHQDEIVFYNQRFLELWSLKASGLKVTSGLDLIMILSDKLVLANELIALYHKLLREPKRTMALEMNLKSGQIFQIKTAPISEQRNKYGRIWHCSDKTTEKLAQANKNEFISTVSHEIRAPLAIITGSISNLKDGILGPIPDKQMHVIHVTSNSLDRINRLINDLLDLSRLESGRIRVKKKEINLVSLLEDLIQQCKTDLEKNKLTIDLKTEQGLGLLFADADRLAQVITNFINNAVRFAKTRIHIELLHSPKHKKHIRVEVTDDGDGIRQEDHERLFKKFEQISRRAGPDAYKGTGLGLAISKEIIAQHDGKIGVESEVGLGATFYFDIPQSDYLQVFEERFRSYLVDEHEEHLHLLLCRLKLSDVLLESLSKDGSKIPVLTKLQDDIVANCLRRSDFIIHNGKDEFRLILPYSDFDSLALVSRIREIIQKRLKNLTGIDQIPGFRFGWARYPEEANSLANLVKRAMDKL